MILQNYALNRSDPQYLSCVSSMENLQIREANGTVYPQALPRIIGSNIKNNNNSDNNYHPLVMLGFAYFLEYYRS
ncbi:MAG: hypothetical protein WA421_18985 [Nitrososphaeraceae archaeon]|jgi:hypothetical protein